MSLTEKLYKAQQAMPDLQKNAINPHFKNSYITLDAVLNAVLPVLHEHGLFLLQMPSHVDGKPALTTQIVDGDDGTLVESTFPLVLDKATSQGQGSALTYARRYALLSTLGLVADEDDDGEAASPQPKVVQRDAPNMATQKGKITSGF